MPSLCWQGRNQFCPEEIKVESYENYEKLDVLGTKSLLFSVSGSSFCKERESWASVKGEAGVCRNEGDADWESWVKTGRETRRKKTGKRWGRVGAAACTAVRGNERRWTAKADRKWEARLQYMAWKKKTSSELSKSSPLLSSSFFFSQLPALSDPSFLSFFPSVN